MQTLTDLADRQFDKSRSRALSGNDLSWRLRLPITIGFHRVGRRSLGRLLAGGTEYSKRLPDIWKQAHPEAVRTYRKAESRYKAERKPLTRAKRILAAQQKREQSVGHKPLLAIVAAYVVHVMSRVVRRCF